MQIIDESLFQINEFFFEKSVEIISLRMIFNDIAAQNRM